MMIDTRQRLGSDHNLDVNINNELVCNLTEYDYMGLKLMNTLSRRKHTEKLCSQLVQKIGMLRRIKTKGTSWVTLPGYCIAICRLYYGMGLCLG